MIRRWLIRALSLTLLIFCAATWLASYWRILETTCRSPNRYSGMGIDSGFLYVTSYEAGFLPGYTWIWKYESATSLSRILAVYRGFSYRFLGFAYFPFPKPSHGITLWIPLYFPTLLATLLLWLVWRKTRPTYTGNAFPIQPATAAPGEPKP